MMSLLTTKKIVKCQLARGEITRELKAASKKHTITTCCWLYCLGFSMEKYLNIIVKTNHVFSVCKV